MRPPRKVFYKRKSNATLKPNPSKMSSKPIVLLLVLFLHTRATVLASDPDPVQDFCIPDTRSRPLRTVRFNILPCKNSSEATPDDFVYSGMKTAGNFSDMGLAAISVNPTIFPGLNTLGMSFVRSDLKVGGVNSPHFHPRATEIAFVVQGTVYSGFVDSSNRVFAKVIEQGEVMVFPRGLVHFQMNVGKSLATVYGCFNSQNPGMQKIPVAIFGSGIKGEVLEKAFGMNAREIGMMRRRFMPKKFIRE